MNQKEIPIRSLRVLLDALRRAWDDEFVANELVAEIEHAGRAAVPDLIELLREEPGKATFPLIDLLCRLKDPRAIKALQEVADDNTKNDQVRQHATRSLIALGERRKARKLLRGLKSLQDKIDRGYDLTDNELSERLDAIPPLAAGRLVESLELLDKISLEKDIQSGPFTYQFGALTKVASAYVREGLVGLRRILQDAASSSDLKGYALYLIQEGIGISGVPVALEVYQTNDQRVREAAARAISFPLHQSRITDSGLRNRIIEAALFLLTDSNNFCRMEAAEILGLIGEMEHLQVLQDAVKKEDSSYVKDAMKSAIRRLRRRLTVSN